MVSKPVLIDQPNLSLAWAEALLALRSTPGRRLSPLTLTFAGCKAGDIEEELSVRSALDIALQGTGEQKVHTVANTIFPQSLWRLAKGDRKAFFAAYLENLPEYVAMEPHKNRCGLYFGRLIAFDLDHKTGERLPRYQDGSVPKGGNQLEFIIQHCRAGIRISMFQAAVFDPARDLSATALLGFPCLQHVTFVPDFANGSLILNAFYATQQLFVKGYGNYLGLARLGRFVADQVDLNLARVNCFVGVEKMEQKPKEGPLLRAVTAACERVLSRSSTGGSR